MEMSKPDTETELLVAAFQQVYPQETQLGVKE
jgi:hypothetical protein